MGHKQHPDALLWRIIYSQLEGDSVADSCKRLFVKASLIRRTRSIFNTYGTLRSPFASTGGRKRIIDDRVKVHVQALLTVRKDWYIDELLDEVTNVSNQKVSLATMWRCLWRCGYTHKQLAVVASERNEVERMNFRQFIAQFSSNQLVFADESAVNRKTLERRHGYSLKGLPAHHAGPFVRGTGYSLLAAICTDGYLSYLIKAGSVKAEDFVNWLIDELLPVMNPYPLPNSVLVMDNCSIHKDSRIADACLSAGVLLVFLPPYSPDFNPIEQSFHLVKTYLQRFKEYFKTIDQVDAIEEACMIIQSQAAVSCYKHANYL